MALGATASMCRAILTRGLGLAAIGALIGICRRAGDESPLSGLFERPTDNWPRLSPG
jgi:hypothetical protein